MSDDIELELLKRDAGREEYAWFLQNKQRINIDTEHKDKLIISN